MLALANTNRIAPTGMCSTAPMAVEPLRNADTAEVLAFLGARPLHTVYMAGFILDNGLVSPLNRGSFYGYRNAEGWLEGVALIGHATLFEARTERALAAFASFAQTKSQTHMLLGEMEKVSSFWTQYSMGGQAPRVMCRELLFELRFPVAVNEAVRGLRQATLDDLELVMPVQAKMAEHESGVNPMEKDPQGFRVRCARRIEQGRIWVMVEDDRLVFKTDVLCSTPEVAYLEGVYVAPEKRGHRIGLRCMSQLTRALLARTKSISLLVNEQHPEAVAFYLRAGFKLRAHYDTIFLKTGTV